MNNTRRIAVIGVGPRGGYAVERLIVELCQNNGLSGLELLLFEGTGNFGNGWVYDINQEESNWININERILELKGREEVGYGDMVIPAFPSYHQWIQVDYDTVSDACVDTYPPRKKIGVYLSQRLSSLVDPLVEAGLVILRTERAVSLTWQRTDKCRLTTESDVYDNLDEVLLTIGHQSTEDDEQLADWDEFSKDEDNLRLFKTPYPVSELLARAQPDGDSIIAIRGFGLATIDVVRGIAEKYGKFTTLDEETRAVAYETKCDIKNSLVPFSLNGLPPVPKPLNAKVDAVYKPTAAQVTRFEAQIGDSATQAAAESPDFLINAFAPVAAGIFAALPNADSPRNASEPELRKLIARWLRDPDFEHPLFTSPNMTAEELMRTFVAMATGQRAASLDFCIGQVWRHCQPSIYEKLSFSACSQEVIAEIVELDESTKRYSYGPPVESIQQLLALIDARVLDLSVLNNPKIEPVAEGWRLSSDGRTVTADVMINAVLEAPKIKAVDAPLVEKLLGDDIILAVHDDLGVSTDDNGYLISEKKEDKVPIALLGRLAKGTIIGVDAILECFGSRPGDWARQAAANHLEWLPGKRIENARNISKA